MNPGGCDRAMSGHGEDEGIERLECFPLPVSIEGYDVEVGGPATVRLFFSPQLGADPRPGNQLSDVVVLEQWTACQSRSCEE
jgi:hypothetical protein